MSVYVYPATAHLEGDLYGVVFPDLPGCVTVADSQKELALNASEALSAHLHGMIEDGEPLPQPSKVESIELTDGDIAVILVTAYVALPREAA